MLKINGTNEFWLIVALVSAIWVITILVIALLHYKRTLDWYAVKHGDKEPIENTVSTLKENINIYSWALLHAVVYKVWSVRKRIAYFSGFPVRQLILNKIVK